MLRLRAHRAALLLATVLVGGSAAVLPAAPAAAHTSLGGSVPAAGAEVGAAPRSVRLDFTEGISSRLARVVVTAPDGTDVSTGSAQVSRQTVTQPLQPLPAAGEYVVAYRVVAEDGHPLTGRVRFTASSSAVSTPTPGPTAAPSAPGSAAPGAGAPPDSTSGGAGSAGAGSTGGAGGAQQPAADSAAAGRSWLVPGLLAGLVAAGVALAVCAARAARQPEGADL